MVFGVEVELEQIAGIGSDGLGVEDEAVLTDADADVLGEGEWESDEGKDGCDTHDCWWNHWNEVGELSGEFWEKKEWRVQLRCDSDLWKVE